MIDLLAIIFGQLIVLGIGFHLGWNARERHAKEVLKSFVEEIEEDTKNDETEIKITIDKHNDCYYVYRMEDQTFMAQGKTRNELEHSLMKLFPGKKFACTHDNLVEVGFAE
jgi:predicted RNase H-like HicB family nuclease